MPVQIFCCETFKRQTQHECEQHGEQCPDNILRYYKRHEEYGIPHPDEISYIAVQFCPWCGSKINARQTRP